MARKKPTQAGAPAWMVTFADMMSLLVCFFVLIISFSVQDEKKMQVVAGSLRIAFGVQREFQAKGVMELDGRPELRKLQLKPVDNNIILMPIPEVTPPQDVEAEEAERAEATWDIVDPMAEVSTVSHSEANTFSEDSDMRAEADFARMSIEEQLNAMPSPNPADWSPEFRDEVLSRLKRAGYDVATVDEPTDAEKPGLAGQAEARRDAADKRLEETLESAVDQLIRDRPDLGGLAEHLVVERGEEGVRVQLVDRVDSAMFPSGSDSMTAETRRMLAAVAEMLNRLPNRIVITGHTDAWPLNGRNGYDNWNLSADRALATRRELVRAGVPARRIRSVSGKGPSEPLIEADPYDARNRRIGILLLREPV